MLASALAGREPRTVAAIQAGAAAHLPPQALAAAKTAAALMAMNNVYYRFTHLVSSKDYEKMPAKLRMNAMVNPGVGRAEFELWSLVVSAINGCGKCMDAHEAELRKAGVTAQEIQAAVRVAAVVHAVSAVLDNEAEAGAEPKAQAA
jgi:alkyl hydroperoxide reductase subunit D